MSDNLTILQQRVDRICSRRGGQAIAVVGDAGMGKTHLGQQLLSGWSGAHLQMHTRTAEMGFAALLENSGVPSWARQTLGRHLGGQREETEVLGTAISALLSHAAPIVVWAEDYHEIADRTAHFWLALARSLPRNKGVALVVTSRTALPEPFAEQRLAPLSAAAARVVLEHQLQGPLPEAALFWLEPRCQGNPLFMLEFVRHLTRSGALYLDGDRWRWREPAASTLPTSVEALIADQLNVVHSPSGSPADGQRLLGLWAMWDTALPDLQLDIETAGALGDLEADTAASLVRDAQASGLLVGHRFGHPLFREVALKETPYRQRRDVARRCVALLNTQPEHAARFLPWAELPAAEAVQVLEQALVSAQAQGVAAACADLLDQLADLVPLHERAATALQAAQALAPLQLERALHRATQACSLDPLGSEALYLCAGLLARSGRGQEAERLLENAPGALRERPDFWACWLETRVGASDFTGALEIWTQHQNELDGFPQVPAQVAMAQLRTGQADQAETSIRRALGRNPEPAERAALLHALGRIQIAQANPHMFATLGEAIEVSAHAGAFSLQAGLLLERARVLSWALQVHAATADAQQAVRLADAQGDPRLLARAQGELASCLMIQGDFEGAQDLLLAAQELLSGDQASMYTILTQLYLCNLSLEWARPQDGLLAVRHARQGLRLTQEVQDKSLLTWVMSISAWAESAHGDLVRAQQQIDGGEAIIRATGQTATAPFYRFARGFLLERQGQTAAAIQAFEEACALGRTMKMAAYAERFGLEADRLRGDRQAAERRLAFFRQHHFSSFAYRTLQIFPPQEGGDEVDAPLEPALSEPTSTPDLLQLNVLGPVQMMQDGEVLAERSAKGFRLLICLLENRLAGRPGVTPDELLEILAPDDDPQQAMGRLRQQIRRLRATYGAACVVRTDYGYALGAEVMSDAELFLKTQQTSLWRGAYAADVPDFLSSARDVLAYGLRLAAYAAEPQDPAEAARLGQILLAMDPFDWPALSLTLRCLREGGEVMTLVSVYTQIRQQCALVGEPLPGTWEDFLASQDMSIG
ncbi:hypothetical protein E7T06_12495 [Deinococcus sp. Arct2-2]|uniref:hypothetical protein n=1 Tax=Deinococcus sp. Arct2-2 TaxID=2568653 RepID=UPI0010A3A346|nr:hypothetical protein [Deinococcus sp. Arct2-2]THF69306.1 hypothetical protein E7T06_12495 [Deinococcus sp. Arct2-2]